MLKYKIEDVLDREGNKKTIPFSWQRGEYVLSKVVLGHSAVLPMLNDQPNSLITSKVEAVDIWDNHVKITTKNTVYYFKPMEDK